MLCPCVTPTPPHPTRSAAMTMTSQTEAKAVCEDRRKPPRADAALRLIDSISRTMKCDGPGRKVDDRVRGAGIAVARLADAAWVQERTGREGIRGVVGHAARLLFVAGPEERWHVGVAGAAVRGLGKRDRSGGALRIGHVLPPGIAKAPVAQSHVARLERPWQRRQHVALRGREPLLMHLRRGGRRRIEEAEVFPRRDGAVVVARHEGGLSLDEEREDV